MKKDKRKLYPYEKVLMGVMTFLLALAVFFLVVSYCHRTTWPNCAAWMCICLANIAKSFIRWDENKQSNIFGLCAFGILFILFTILLVYVLV